MNNCTYTTSTGGAPWVPTACLSGLENKTDTAQAKISLCVPVDKCGSAEGTDYVAKFGEDNVVKGYTFTTTAESACTYGGREKDVCTSWEDTADYSYNCDTAKGFACAALSSANVTAGDGP